MKGQELQVVLISVFLVAFLVASMMIVSGKFFGDKGVYEKFTKPAEWIGGTVGGAATKEYRNFLSKVQAIFTGDTFSVMCTEWFTECEGASSPWNNKPNLGESDINEASMYLCFDKGSEPRKKIDEQWSKADAEFARYSDEQKREIMKNACLAKLRDMMTEENVE